MTSDITSILPFFDAYTAFVILLMGFIFLELTYNFEQNSDKEKSQKSFFAKATDIEKLLWFVVFGFIIYFIPLIGWSNVLSITLHANPRTAIALSNLHSPLFYQFFKLNSIWNLLSTNWSLFANTVLQNTFLYFLLIFISFIFFIYFFIIKSKNRMVKISNSLVLYLAGTLFIFLIFLDHLLYLFFGVILFIFLLIFYFYIYKSKFNAIVEKHQLLFIILILFLFFNIYITKFIGNWYTNLIYFLVIGLDLFFIFILLLFINKENNNKFQDMYYVGLAIILIILIQISSSGFVKILPNGNTTLNNITANDLSYQISGYISSNNNSKISAINVVKFRGYVNFSKGLNYSYLSIYNNTTFAKLEPFYQDNPIYDIKHGILPPGILINMSSAPCSFKVGIKCYPYILNNTTYIIIHRNSTIYPTNTPVIFFYNLNTNSSLIARRLHYTYLLNKSCTLQQCELNLTFNSILNTSIVLQNFDVYLPYNYSNITITASNFTCSKNLMNLNTYYICNNKSNQDNEIAYPNSTTNYFEIVTWMIHNNLLNLHINMKN